MNINDIMDELEILYREKNIDQVKVLLEEKIKKLKEEAQIFPAITLVNELLGIYRELDEVEKGEACCQELISLFEENSLKKDENYGTTLLNIATAQRAFGHYSVAKEYYQQCLEIFQRELSGTDYRFASLYNNMSLLYSEMEDFPTALVNLEKSLEILRQLPRSESEIATANTSIGQIYLRLEDFPLARKHLDFALDIFSQKEDFHFSATLTALGDLEFLEKNYDKSAEFYEMAMVEVKKYLGLCEHYYYLEKSLAAAKEASASVKGLGLCKRFYLEHGAPMIKELFSEYEDKIAIGLLGPGSECYGFDDEISRDHDFSPRFYLWLPHDLYLEIGIELQRAYEALPAMFEGVPRKCCSEVKREGVFSIPEFYEEIMGLPEAPKEEMHWFYLEEYLLAEATNGAVFRDDLGEFTAIREALLAYYPPEVLRKKIGEKAHLVSQTGQYNLQRTLKRGDLVTAGIILAQFQVHSIELWHLLNKSYCPYYKWMYRKAKTLSILPHLSRKLAKIQSYSLNDPALFQEIEDIVAEFIIELQKQGYIKKTIEGNFLDDYIKEIVR